MWIFGGGDGADASQVLDYAILVISGADGVQAHTRTLFGLLAKYEVPVFLFVNKMDQPGTDQEALLLELKRNCIRNCVDFSDQESGFCGKCGGVR